jgi:uncharacterized protein
MPVTPTYPGIYIEEVPSNARTITAAPTSIAVFIGYSHPFKTEAFNRATRIQNFTEFEREFGGLFASDIIPAHLPYAVNQFFLNGGSDCYVVGLESHFYDAGGTLLAPDLAAPSVDLGGITFTALEPADANHPMRVTLSNPLGTGTSNTVDIAITYGSRTETYRKVNLTNTTSPDHIEKRLGTAANRVSSLVTVAPQGAAYVNILTGDAALNTPTTLAITPPAALAGVFNANDFNDVFQPDSDLDKVSIFNLLILPGISASGVLSEALAFAERKRAFLIMDPPQQHSADGMGGLPEIGGDSGYIDSGSVPKSTNGAFYFPWLNSIDPLSGRVIELPPSGYVAGIYARTDQNRGVWKAPAGLETVILNTIGVVERGRMTDQRQGILNPQGVNSLRTFPGVGTVVFGARTLVTANSALQQHRYVPVRRTTLFIEQTLYRELRWAIFEPNDVPLWNALKTSVDAFMLTLFRQGAFQGQTPSVAFQVKCDSSTTTQTDIDNGIVNIIVGFRPLKPAEFVIVKIAQLAGQAEA